MGINIYDISRTQFVNITLPTSNSTTVSTGTSAYIPAGAIITGVKVHSGDAVTVSQLSNLTFNIYVGTQVIGSNNNVVSAKMVQTVPSALGLASTAGILVPSGGNIILHLGSGTSVTGGIAADADIYVDYLYCNDRDDA
jgi:hypothetical protein